TSAWRSGWMRMGIWKPRWLMYTTSSAPGDPPASSRQVQANHPVAMERPPPRAMRYDFSGPDCGRRSGSLPGLAVCTVFIDCSAALLEDSRRTGSNSRKDRIQPGAAASARGSGQTRQAPPLPGPVGSGYTEDIARFQARETTRMSEHEHHGSGPALPFT